MQCKYNYNYNKYNLNRKKDMSLTKKSKAPIRDIFNMPEDGSHIIKRNPDVC
jgi:hypothetical protein